MERKTAGYFKVKRTGEQNKNPPVWIFHERLLIQKEKYRYTICILMYTHIQKIYARFISNAPILAICSKKKL